MARRTPEQEAWITTEDGVILEARALVPDTPRGLAVLCHPHPIGDGERNKGTMDNKIVHGTMRVLRDLGVASVRFNFRGAGHSGGVHDEGEAEQLDVQAALRWLREELGVSDDPSRGGELANLVMGYSFGSWVGLRALREDPWITHRLVVGPPLSAPGYGWEVLDEDQRPLEILVGEGDEFCAMEDVEALVERLPYPVGLRVVPEGGHFFLRQGHVVRRELEDYCRGLFGAAEE